MQTLRRWWDDKASEPRGKMLDLSGALMRSGRLEVNVVEHCNLSCRACSHLSPVAAKDSVDPDELARDLALLAPVYRTAELRFVGGEPLLHPRLLDLVGVVRRSGIADSIGLVTNGVLLARAPAELWSAFDRIDVSLYPGKEPSEADRAAFKTSAAVGGTRLAVRHVSTFRESFSALGTADDALVARVFGDCAIREYHTLAHGRLYRCPPSFFLPKVLGLEVDDGIELAGGDGFAERLRTFLANAEPRGSCRNCLGTSGVRFAHAQTPRDGFLGLQRRPTEELLDRRYPAGARRWRRVLSLRT